MKKIKTTTFSFGLLGTTFIALGYFCEKCRMTHEWPGECNALVFLSCGMEDAYDTMLKEDIDKAIKDKIRHCRTAGEAFGVMSELGSILTAKETEVRYRGLFNIHWTQERIDEVRKLLKNVSETMWNHSVHKDCGRSVGMIMDEILNWDEVFGAGCTHEYIPSIYESGYDCTWQYDSENWEYDFSPFGC